MKPNTYENIKTVNVKIELDFCQEAKRFDFYIFVNDKWVYSKDFKSNETLSLMEIIRNGSRWLEDTILCEIIDLESILERKNHD